MIWYSDFSDTRHLKQELGGVSVPTFRIPQWGMDIPTKTRIQIQQLVAEHASRQKTAVIYRISFFMEWNTSTKNVQKVELELKSQGL